LAGRDLSVTEVSDDGGTVRVRLVLPTWDDYVRAAVTDVLPAAAVSPMVLARVERLLDRVGEVAPASGLPALARVRADLAARRARP
jgi:uncharacterized membrane protein